MLQTLAGSMAAKGELQVVQQAEEANRPPPPKVVRRKKPARVVRQLVPDEILKDENLNRAIGVLNPNYEFEVRGREETRVDAPRSLSLSLSLSSSFC